ncbi:MAG: N-6 DNA methylase, partial [Planctomycetes bacterium]|nr:N-6 DNA methylase [Planctomycetota bacterium]
FEELIRRFNEQSNENPGEHFTPREVIRLMVRLVLNGDKEMLGKQAVVRTVYDPACGTGGMLSIAKEYVQQEINPDADMRLFGQEVNDETYAVCKSDMLMKGDDRDAENIKPDTTLSNDGHPRRKFDYQLSNPPFGKDWKKEADAIKLETSAANGGRFGAGLPRSSDGQMLFLLHMISKMQPVKNGGGRMAIVMNGSPLFTGGAGSGESEIRRWILETDRLEAIVALPSQLFYNTGINTYIWVLTNRKERRCKGKVLLINGAATEEVDGDEKEVFARKMRKSLGDKRNELAPEHINELARLAVAFADGPHTKIFDSPDFGYRRVTVERPLRLNFRASPERIELVKQTTAFQKLAVSKKRDKKAREKEEAEGSEQQKAILAVLDRMDGEALYKNRDAFAEVFDHAFAQASINLAAPLKKAILGALSERDETAAVCLDKDGNPEPDPDLRDYENVPLKDDVDEFFAREVAPHVPDAWINEKVCDHKDGEVGKVGYEINFNRYFYQYKPPRPLEEIDADIKRLESEIMEMLREVTG